VTTSSYAETAWQYRGAGWVGVVPLPPSRKGPPPRGYTGWAGVDPSGPDVQAWVDGPEGAGNIGLRLPEGVYGLDVDAYGEKEGAAALAELLERFGELPETWVITSRDDSVSGIRLFRAELPIGRRWRDEPAGHGRGIEAIHYGHRYAVTWPSVHPDTGAKYVVRSSVDWHIYDEPPRLDELPPMPAAWVEGLSETGEVSTAEAASHDVTLAVVTAFAEGEPCDRVREAHARGLARLRDARDGAALHPAARDTTHELARLGHEGHTGARRALAEHFGVFVDVRGGRGLDRSRAEAEWWRLVRGAVGKLAGERRQSCDCALLAGEGVQFDAPIGTAAAPPEAVGPEDAGGQHEAGEEPAADLAGQLLGRMLTVAQMREMQPPPMLVDGLLGLDSESWMIAKSGSFKTFVALDIAAHVGVGRPWMERDVTQGPVVYLAAEGAGGMGKRLRAWEQRNGPMDGVRFLPMPIQAAREDHWAALVEACRRLQPVLIILDTQARITVGLDENDNSAMGQFIEAIGQLRRATQACVLVIHHLGRSGNDARGASAIDGAQDSELRLTKTAEYRVVLETDKQRHLPIDVRIELELFPTDLDDGSDSLVVGPPLSATPPLPDWSANLKLNQLTLVEVMHDIFPEIGATKAELKAEVLKRTRRDKDGNTSEPMADSSFRRAWDSLVANERLIKVSGTQRYVLGDDPQRTEGASDD